MPIISIVTGKYIKSDDRRESAISPEHLGMTVYHYGRAIICNPKFYIEKKFYRDYTEKRNRTGNLDEFTRILTDNHRIGSSNIVFSRCIWSGMDQNYLRLRDCITMRSESKSRWSNITAVYHRVIEPKFWSMSCHFPCTSHSSNILRKWLIQMVSEMGNNLERIKTSL